MDFLQLRPVKFKFQDLRRLSATILKTVKSPYLYNRSIDFDKIWQIIESVYSVRSDPTRIHAHVMAYLPTLIFHINTCSNFVAIAHRFAYLR